MTTRFGLMLTRTHWMDFCCLLFGVVLLSEFFTLLQNGFFTAAGMHERLSLLLKNTENYQIVALLSWAIRYIKWFAPLCGVALFVTSVGLCLLLARTWLMYCTTLIFLVYSLFHLSSQFTWLFEYLLPFFFALIISLAKTGDLILQGRNKLLGFKLFNTPRQNQKIIFLVVSTAFLFSCLLIAKNSGSSSLLVAVLVSSSYAFLFIVGMFLEPLRVSYEGYEEKVLALKGTRPFFYQLHHVQWLSLMAVIIGAMLVFQVYENNLLNSFTIDGYKAVVIEYRNYSHVSYVSNILNYVISHADVIMAFQMAIEPILALFLVIQIFRFSTSLLTFFLFSALTYLEFNTPNTWPVIPFSDSTWLWELLLSTVIIFMVTGQELGKLLIAKTKKEALLGRNLFGNTSLKFRFFTALAGGALLTLIIITGHEAEEVNLTLAIASGLTLFCYVLLLAAVDLCRESY